VRVVAALVCLIAVAASARADAVDPATKAKAEELAAGARRKINDAGDFAGASDLYLQAYELTKELPYLVNVAVALRKAKLPQQAVTTYRRCLDEGGNALTPELRAQIVEDIDKITKESAQVKIRTGGAAAFIDLDDRTVGTATKDAALLVLVSTEGGLNHRIRAAREGYKPAERALGQLRAGEVFDIELEPGRIATTGVVHISSTPETAHLVLTGRGVLGDAPQTLELPPGDYYVTGTLGGYSGARERVTVIAGQEHRVVLRLTKVERSWWDRNKVKVLIVAGAVVVGGGAAFGTYELMKPDYDGIRITYP
jgi:hypothetical protein